MKSSQPISNKLYLMIFGNQPDKHEQQVLKNQFLSYKSKGKRQLSLTSKRGVRGTLRF